MKGVWRMDEIVIVTTGIAADAVEPEPTRRAPLSSRRWALAGILTGPTWVDAGDGPFWVDADERIDARVLLAAAQRHFEKPE